MTSLPQRRAAATLAGDAGMPAHGGPACLDAVDHAIVAVLARDARTTLRQLADLTGLSTSAVHARVERLTDAGVIRETRAVLDYAALGMPVTALITVTAGATCLDEITEHIAGFREVVSCYTVAGEDSLALLVRTSTLPALGRLRHDLVAGTDATTHTKLVLHTHFEDRPTTPPYRP